MKAGRKGNLNVATEVLKKETEYVVRSMYDLLNYALSFLLGTASRPFSSSSRD